MGYEEDFTRFLTDIQSDVERKIFRGHDRLKMNKQREMVVTAAFLIIFFLCGVLLKMIYLPKSMLSQGKEQISITDLRHYLIASSETRRQEAKKEI